MHPTKLRMSVAEFEAFIREPEQLEQDFEYVGGEVVAVVSNNYSSEIAALIMT